MSEKFWSDEELIYAAETIVDNEHKELSHSLNEYYSHRTDAMFIAGCSTATLVGSVALAKVEVDSWLSFPHATGVVGLAGLGLISSVAALQSVYWASRARNRLIE